MQAPPESGSAVPAVPLQARPPGQRRTAHGAVEFRLHLRAEVEGEPDVVAAALDLIDDVDAA